MSVCNVKERVGTLSLLQCGAGIAVLVCRSSLKVQKSRFRSVDYSREWEKDFRRGEEM